MSSLFQVAHLHTVEEECTVLELLSIEDKKTGEIKKRPRYARQGAIITARLKVLPLGRCLSPLSHGDPVPQID